MLIQEGVKCSAMREWPLVQSIQYAPASLPQIEFDFFDAQFLPRSFGLFMEACQIDASTENDIETVFR